MNPILILLWIPYILLIILLVRKRSLIIYGLGITIIMGLINYELPFFFGQTVRMYHVSILIFLFFLIKHGIVSRFRHLRYSDKYLRNLIVVFYILLTFSYLIGEVQLPNSLTYIYKVIDYPILGIITVFSLKDYRDIRTLLIFILLGSVIMILIGFGQFFTSDPTWGELADISYNNELFRGIEGRSSLSGKEWRIASTATSPNSFGLVIAMIIPFYFYFIIIDKHKYVFSILIVISIAALIITGARTAIFSTLFIFIPLLFRRPNIFKYIGLGLTGLFLIGISFSAFENGMQLKQLASQVSRRFETIESAESIQENFEASRIRKWTRSWDENADPDLFLLGHGWIQRPGTAAPHNTFLSTLFLSGLWGLLSYLAIILYSFRRTYKLRRDPLMYSIMLSLIVYVICGISYENVINTSVFVFWPVIGILAKYTYLRKYSTNGSL